MKKSTELFLNDFSYIFRFLKTFFKKISSVI